VDKDTLLTKTRKIGLTSDEINPQHPVTKTLHDQWHKLCLLLIDKLNDGDEVVITEADVKQLAVRYPDHAILAHDKKDGLHLRIVSMAEAKKLGAQES